MKTRIFTDIGQKGGWVVKAISKISQFIFFGNRAGVGIHLYSVNLTDFRVIIEKISFHYVFFINRQIREVAPPFALEQLIFSF